MDNANQPSSTEQTPNTQPDPALSQPAAPAPAQTADAIVIPDTWPGAFGIFGISKQIVSFNAVTLVVLIVIGAVVSAISDNMKSNMLVSLIGAVINIIIYLAVIKTMLESVKSKKVEIADSFKYALNFNKAGNLFLLSIIAAFVGFFSLLLFIIPFFIIMPRLALAPYLLIRDDLNAIDALQASWNLTKGNVAKVWGILGVMILFALLIVVLIGIYLSIVYMAAFVVLLEYLKKSQPVAEPAVAVGTPAQAADTNQSSPPTPAA